MDFFRRCDAFYTRSVPEHETAKGQLTSDLLLHWYMNKQLPSSWGIPHPPLINGITAKVLSTYPHHFTVLRRAVPPILWRTCIWKRDVLSWMQRRFKAGGGCRGRKNFFPPSLIESTNFPVTYQLLSTNKAAHKSPFLAVYEPGRGGLLLSSLWRSSMSFSSWPPNEK